MEEYKIADTVISNDNETPSETKRSVGKRIRRRRRMLIMGVICSVVVIIFGVVWLVKPAITQLKYERSPSEITSTTHLAP